MAEQKPKIGAGHASAMFRQGLRELRAAFYPESNVAQPSEYGIWGTRTPGEVSADRRDDPSVQRLEQEPKAAGDPPGRSPSEIAARARGNAHGQDAGPGRSPSEIAARARGGVHGPEPQQERGQEPQQEHGQEHSHGL